MSLDCKVRESIQEEAKGIVAPPELKEKVIVQIKMNRGGSKVKKTPYRRSSCSGLFNPDNWFCSINLLWQMVYTGLLKT